MPTQQTARLLVKASPAAVSALAGSSFSLDEHTFVLEPLFLNEAAQPAFGLQAEPTWFVADTRTPAGDVNLWELAHAATVTGMGLAGAGPVYAEPDLVQQFPYPAPEVSPFAFSAVSEDQCAAEPQSNEAPLGPGFGWHLRDDFSGLRKARNNAEHGNGVRVGILDTGYDPDHKLLPANLLADLGRDFEDEGRPNATDPDRGGFLQNPGHGTGTISILAGNRLSQVTLPPEATGDDFYGGAPLASVVPVRIANSVILFRNSALARGLEYLLAPGGDPARRVDVVSISMGGVPSGAWADIVNRAYEQGVFIAAAAGNSQPGGIPTRHIVYPARFNRVTAACGVMANRQPYKDLPGGAMEGNFGPASKMATAIAAFTPNIGWAKLGCPATIRLNGRGTSSATPQVAAAAALWLAKNRNVRFDHGWQRVEAIRKALFDAADKSRADHRTFFGNGVLDASKALSIVPALADLRKQEPDSARFGFLRILTGLGVAVDEQKQAMFDLEIVQLAQTSPRLAAIVPDPGVDSVSDADLRQFVEAVVEDKRASRDLRLYLAERYGVHFGGKPVPLPAAPQQEIRSVRAPDPPYRCIRAYAFDPSLSLELDTEAINTALVELPWTKLEPGPADEYLEVIDQDLAGKPLSDPVNLDAPGLVAQDGLPPSQDNPQFHQQMVYAVARKTIEFFVEALGRPIFWSGHELDPANPFKNVWLPRLKIYPHALSAANAFYSPSPERKALLFGSFKSKNPNLAEQLPNELIFTCLSHDIIAHETTHAILDGTHYRLREPTNPDMLAFHEGFSDVVALFQHFAIPDVLASQVIAHKGDLRMAALLTDLARQFGKSTGRRGALRSAIGVADPTAYQTKFEAHDRGAILVAAVFDAFLTAYQRRAAATVDVASGGSGVLPAGKLPRAVAQALAAEASDCASTVLRMCIRALDYIPPVDLTYGDYLRALITADNDYRRDDRFGYRLAFVDAFRKRGIYPEGLKTLSVEGLLWPSIQLGAELADVFAPLFETLREFSQTWRYAPTRRELFDASTEARVKLHDLIPALLEKCTKDQRKTISDRVGLALQGEDESFEVHSLTCANRVKPDRTTASQIVLEVTQSRRRHLDEGAATPSKPFWFRGGSTLVIDLEAQRIRYAIIKDASSEQRFAAQRDYLLNKGVKGLAYFRNQQFATTSEPFAYLHEEGEALGG